MKQALILVLTFLAALALAQAQAPSDRFFIVEDLSNGDVLYKQRVNDVDRAAPISAQHGYSRAGGIVSIGQLAWSLVQDNQPSINSSSSWTGAVPPGITADDWQTMSGWKPFSSQALRFKWTNDLWTLTSFDFIYSWNALGSYNGTGNYITLATVVDKDVYAAPSEHLECGVTVSPPINVGTTDNVIAAIQMKVVCSSHGDFEKSTAACIWQISGDGNQQRISCDMN